MSLLPRFSDKKQKSGNVGSYIASAFDYAKRLVTIVDHGGAVGDEDDRLVVCGQDVVEQLAFRLGVEG